MKHKFEEYFQLPWSIKRRTVCWEMGVEENFVYLDLNGESGEHASEGVPSLVDFTARRHNVDFDKYDVNNAREDALKYLVQCANLMPEAVEILKDFIIATTSNDRSPDGLDYTEDVIQRAEALLTKLEGGAETE